MAKKSEKNKKKGKHGAQPTVQTIVSGRQNQRPTTTESSRSNLKLVPKLIVTDKKLIAPPTLPMRHDHPHVPATEMRHPEVRLVIKTRYMEQRPHVLLIESGILATIIIIFFGLLLFELRITFPLMLSVLLPIWTLFVILLYKFFED